MRFHSKVLLWKMATSGSNPMRLSLILLGLVSCVLLATLSTYTARNQNVSAGTKTQGRSLTSRPLLMSPRRINTKMCAKMRASQLKSATALASAGLIPASLLTSAAVAQDHAQRLQEVSEMDLGTTVITQGVPLAIAGLLAVQFLDPEKRRQEMTAAAGGDEMQSVANYFNGEGFERWRKIYGETDEVNKVQLDIRDGHAVTVDKVLNWLEMDGGVQGKSVCDAGCGTGSLTIPLALKGAEVSASDIAVEMTKEAKSRYEDAAAKGVTTAIEPKFEAKNLEEIEGKYDVVTCLDVMIHYPDNKANSMVKHLASLANKRLIISFAPKTFYYSTLKRIGELFPGPSKATRAYLHAEEDVERALNEAGWKVVRREMTATNFYFSRLLEAVPA